MKKEIYSKMKEIDDIILNEKIILGRKRGKRLTRRRKLKIAMLMQLILMSILVFGTFNQEALSDKLSLASLIASIFMFFISAFIINTSANNDSCKNGEYLQNKILIKILLESKESIDDNFKREILDLYQENEMQKIGGKLYLFSDESHRKILNIKNS